MADTTLNDLIHVMRSEMKQTDDLIDAQTETTKSVDDLTGVLVRKFFGGDSLEDKIEGSSKTGGTTGAGISKALEKTTGSNSLGDLASLYGALRLLTSPLGIATLASLTGFDAAIKALDLPRLVKNAKASLTALGTSLKSITEFKLPKLPKITFEDGSWGKIKLPQIPIPRFITSAGEAIGEFIDFKIRLPVINFVDAAGTKISDFIDYKIKLPVINFVDAAGTKIADFIDYKIKLPVINFVDDAGKAITNFIDFKIKLPAINFIDDAGKFIDNIKFKLSVPAISFLNQAGDKISKIDLKVPEIPKIGFLSAVGDYVSKIDLELPKFPKISFGVGEDGVSIAEKFAGAFGKVTDFLDKAYGFLKPLLKPIELVLKTVLRPFTQILISVIDFVTGFYDGFTSEEEGATFGEKLIAGIEGGLLGVVKGITEAFDLLFITIPAWLLEKFGMENAAEILRGFSFTDMVDPVWNGIKNVVRFVGDNFGLMRDLVAAEFNYQVTRITNGFKNAFDKVFNFINNLGDELYIILSESLQFSFPGITIPKPTSSLIPDFIKDRFPFEVMPTFSVGLGDDSSRAVARSRINANNSSTAERVSTRDSETAAALQRVQDIANELGKGFQQLVVNNIDNSNTDNSNSSTTTAVATGNNNDGFALVQ